MARCTGILDAEQATVSSIASPSRYKEYTREQLDIVNLIMFMMQNNAAEDNSLTDPCFAIFWRVMSLMKKDMETLGSRGLFQGAP